MSSKQLRRLRQQAYENQNRRCYYCDFPIWDVDGTGFARAHALPPRFAKYLKCTAEHLVARQDKGRDTADNIVAACSWCNKMRHYRREHQAPHAVTHKSWVSKLVSMGRWHPLAARKRMLGLVVNTVEPAQVQRDKRLQ
jgi:hypothetical protein